MLKPGNEKTMNELDWQHWSRRWGSWAQWRETYSAQRGEGRSTAGRHKLTMQDWISKTIDSSPEFASLRLRRKRDRLANLRASASSWLRQIR